MFFLAVSADILDHTDNISKGVSEVLTRLELSNFRAFKHAIFYFSKLNIFVGANSSGKSSALSALNLLAQSISSYRLGGSNIILNGHFDQLGTFKDMVHGGRANTPIKISMTIDEFEYEFEMKYRLQRREIEISYVKLTSEGKPIYEYRSAKDRYDVYIMGQRFENAYPKSRKVRPKFDGFIPTFRDMFLYIRNAMREHETLKIDSPEYASMRDLERTTSKFRNLAIRTFTDFDTLGAFREMPKRTYLWSGETANNIGRAGENTVTMLANDASRRGAEQVGLEEEISKWLIATKISNGVRVKHLTERHFELVSIGGDGSDHNICDVGFGVSQVLPVLAAGVNLSNISIMRPRSSPLLVIQEPEIHLHPNAQAELGTFFASLTKLENQVFLETHSDNLVLRIARHVAEQQVKPEDVNIYFLSDSNGEKINDLVKISKEGSFDPEWPGGFFPQRQSESFALAKASFSKPNNTDESIDEEKNMKFAFMYSGT